MNTLDKKLELLAAAQPDEALVEVAQRKLEALIKTKVATRRSTRRIGGWLAAAVSAGVVALAFVWLPFASTPALAFAEVQEHFRDFRTMRFDMTQRMSGEVMLKTRVNLTRDGKVRTDVGTDVSVIVNPAERRVSTLIHSAHMAVVTPLEASEEKEKALDWLKDIRDFQGLAKQLPGTRVIDGQTVYGWELEVEDGTLVLWATASGLPLQMFMSQAQLQFDFRFEFNPPLAPELFSTTIPTGYSAAPQED
jgi:outer membrane lipoprotein-sorting protein